MKVLKFGGTSVGTPERIKSLPDLITGQTGPVIVVLSAMAGTTNHLLEISGQLLKKDQQKANGLISSLEEQYTAVAGDLYSVPEFLDKGMTIIREHFEYLRSFTQDMFTINELKCIVAEGELLSSSLVHLYFQQTGIRSVLIPALNFIRTDREQEPDQYYIKENLARELEKHPGETIMITQGFICRNVFGEIDNLKRGGSDYSASLIGVAANADEIQIWTDVDGFHDNDPRFVKDTMSIPELSFDEAAELAYFGAKILHPSTILPAKVAGIPVTIKNTLNPGSAGTTISDKTKSKGVKAVAAKDGITAIRVKSGRMLLAYGFMRKVFEIFEIYKTPIDMITTSEISISLTIDDESQLENITNDLKHYGTVETDREQTIISVVGEGIAGENETMVRIFSALSDVPVRMIAYGGSQNNISILTGSEFKSKALNALSRHLFKH